MNGGNQAPVQVAARHALGWLVFGNSVGLWLALLLIWPGLQSGAWTYGRWMPAHLNVQLYGWTSLPLVAWLFAIYEVDRGRARSWVPALVWGWSAALAMGVLDWLEGGSSGKLFLDWKGGALWAFLLVQAILWTVHAVTWWERAVHWSAGRRWLSLAGLLGLAAVPVSLVYACSPDVYPPVDRTTGGPTGASLLGSTLVVVGLMLLLPRALGVAGCGRAGWKTGAIFGFSWLYFGVAEHKGGTHFDGLQKVALALLLPWVRLLPRDWSGFEWPAGSGGWRAAMLGWWGLLAITGFLMYQPGWLDRLKFTQGLVAHSHLAMVGFTTSFCAVVLETMAGRRLGGARSLMLWHGAVVVMVLWIQGNGGWRIPLVAGAVAATALGFPKHDAAGGSTAPDAARGRQVYLAEGCIHCLTPSSSSLLSNHLSSDTCENPVLATHRECPCGTTSGMAFPNRRKDGRSR